MFHNWQNLLKRNSIIVSFNSFDFHDEVNNKHIDVQEGHYNIVREIGAASAVLLKNEGNALPLRKPRSIVIIGDVAGPALHGPNGFSDRGGDDGVLGMGWGSGTAQFPYLVSPLEAIQARARRDRTSVSWWLDNFNTAGAAELASGQDVAVSVLSNHYHADIGVTPIRKKDRLCQYRLRRRIHHSGW